MQSSRAHGERFDLLLGRRTYEIWSGFSPKAPSSPMSDALNAATKYIAAHRPESLERGAFESLGPDTVEDIRRINDFARAPDLSVESREVFAGLDKTGGQLDLTGHIMAVKIKGDSMDEPSSGLLFHEDDRPKWEAVTCVWCESVLVANVLPDERTTALWLNRCCRDCGDRYG